MKLYLYLAQRVPWPVAMAVTVVWLTVMLFLAIFFATEPAADFRYGTI